VPAGRGDAREMIRSAEPVSHRVAEPHSGPRPGLTARRCEDLASRCHEWPLRWRSENAASWPAVEEEVTKGQSESPDNVLRAAVLGSIMEQEPVAGLANGQRRAAVSVSRTPRDELMAHGPDGVQALEKGLEGHAPAPPARHRSAPRPRW